MTSETSRTSRDLWVAAGTALVLSALAGCAYLAHSRSGSPILVGDGGSIILESSKGDPLADFIEVNDNLIVSAEKLKMHKLIKKGFAGSVAQCKGSEACRVELTFNDPAASTVIVSTDKKGKGVWVSSSIPFTSWNRSDPKKWILGGGELKVAGAKVFGTDKDGAPLCSAPGCTVEVDYSN